MEALKKDKTCGCFYCGTIFDLSEISDWIIADNNCDRSGTARCPCCGIDSVISKSSGFPITRDFLRRMHMYWFS